MLVPFKELLSDAKQNHYIVGYFESWDTYSLEAVINAAEAQNSPVIIGFGGHTMNFDWFTDMGIEILGAMGLQAARNSRVPVSFLLNEAPDIPLAIKGIKSGFNAVMPDFESVSFDEKIAYTKQLVEIAHASGVGVEGELGELPDAGDQLTQPADTTQPDNAAEFVRLTGVDALSISVGNVHLQTESHTRLDIDLIRRIHEAVGVPLVLHGGSGISDDEVGEISKIGVAKINVGTCLKKAFIDGMRAYFAEYSELDQVHLRIGCRNDLDIMLAGQEAMQTEVIRRIRLYNPLRGGKHEKV